VKLCKRNTEKKMRKNVAVTTRKERLKDRLGMTHTDGYPLYPVGDDIYNKFHEEADIDPEDISREMDSIEFDKSGKGNLRNPIDIESGSNLDVPGSEPDDDRENIGSEDEENNYYSIGGDSHNNLDENQGE
jgi:hypothetical protein